MGSADAHVTRPSAKIEPMGSDSAVEPVWCEECAASYPREALGEDGTCPVCGRVIAGGSSRVPWHFRLLAGGTVVYLGYRLYQGVEWVAHHI